MQRVANIPRFALHVRNASRRNRCQTDPQLCTKPPNNLRIYVSKKQWVPSAAETYSEDNPTGFFLGAGTFTAKEKQMIAADPTLRRAFGVCVRVVNGTLKRRAFFVHKKSPYDNGGLCIIIR